MKVHELLWAHKYAELIEQCEQRLANNPNDMTAIEGLAEALRAKSEYGKSLLFFERLAAQRREEERANVAPSGSDAWQIDITCLNWILGDCSKAIQMMHNLAAGILNGSLNPATPQVEMTQGLLLYYMGVTENDLKETSFALDYMGNRVKQAVGEAWPWPVAQYYLGNMTFEDVIKSVSRRRNTAKTIDIAKVELMRRRRPR